MRLTRTRTLVAATALTATALTSFATANTVTATEPDAATGYTVTQPLCSAPADPSAMRCFGLKQVPVARGTRGAAAVRTNATRGPAGGYTPKILASAYGFNPKIKRANLTVGIVLWHDAPNVLSDLNAFNKRYGLPKETSRSFRKVNERGRTSPLPKRDRGAAGEIALDTQAVRAVCNTCRILLVEADDAYDDDLANAVNTAVRLGANIVTNSYGTPERRFSAKMQAAYYHPGVAIVASTGDSGWFGWDYANDPRDEGDGTSSFPASSPYVVAVGGTTLSVDAAGHRTAETVWNDNGPHNTVGDRRNTAMGASGGGCSTRFAARPWQAHAPGYSRANCHSHRLAADVSMVADPGTGFDVYDTYGSGGWVTIGGTSLSAPLVAGMFALAGGPGGARFASSALYGNASAYPARRFDVTTGGSGYCATDSSTACASATRLTHGTSNPNNLGLGPVECTFSRRGGESVPRSRSNECNATVGYDGPSGVGTPRSIMLFARTDPKVAVTVGRVTHRKAATFRAPVSEPLPRTRVTKLTWSWGDGKTSTTKYGTIRHTYAKKGRYTVSVTVQDSRFQTSVAKRTITAG